MELNMNEIARCLNVPVGTLDRWIRQGRIPLRKSGTSWSFDAERLQKWADSRHLPFTLPGHALKSGNHTAAPETLLSAMERGGVHTGLAGSSVSEILAAAADCVPGLDELQKKQLHDTLMERERLTSTGMGKGVAIPHPRTPRATALKRPMIVTCYPLAPLEFNAIDDQPVFILFLLLSTSVKIHLHLLSRLAFCVRDNAFVRFLKEAPSGRRFFSKIAEVESTLEKSEIL